MSTHPLLYKIIEWQVEYMKRSLLILSCLLIVMMTGCGDKNTDKNVDSKGNAIATEKSVDNDSTDNTSSNKDVENKCAYKMIRKIYSSDNTLKNKSEVEFNSEGNELKETRYDKNGNLLSYAITEYNEDNKKVKYGSYDEEGNEKYSYSYEYNKQGDLIKEVEKNEEETDVRVYEYEYTDKGQIENRVLFENDEFSYEKRFTYDDKGNLIKEESFNEEGQSNIVFEYTYDNNNNVIGEKYQGPSLTMVTEKRYDANGNEIESMTFENDNSYPSIWSTYEYDEKGNCIKSNSVDIDGIIDSWKIMEYDDKGREIKCTSHTIEGLESIRECEYVEME